MIIQKPSVIPLSLMVLFRSLNAAHVTDACLVLDAIDHMELTDWQKGKSVHITKPILRVEVDKQRKLNPGTLKLSDKV